MRLLSILERVELRDRAPQSDVGRSRLDKIDGYETPIALPMPRLDNKMRERPENGINDDACQFPARAVASRNFATDREPRSLVHHTFRSRLS